MTRQIPDTLYYNGKKYYVDDGPLQLFFEEFPEKRPITDVLETDLYRGYIATFEIIGDELFVKKLEVLRTNTFAFETVAIGYPETSKFDWFSGLIRIEDPKNKLHDRDPGYRFQLLEIRNGNLVRVRTMDREQLRAFKEAQLGYFLLSDDFPRFVARMRSKNSALTDKQLEAWAADMIC